VHRDGLADSGAIHAADITILFVEAHVAMDGSDFFERCIDRLMQAWGRQPSGANRHQRSQPGLSTLNDRVV